MIEKIDLSKIGIGTWGIGGLRKPDPANDDESQMKALVYSINKGVNYVETVFSYAGGKAVEILAKAIRKSKINREKLFITLTVYQSDASTISEAGLRLDDFLRILRLQYVDSVQFSMGFVRTVGITNHKRFVQALLKLKKVRYTSLTNANLEYLKQYHAAFGSRLFAHEGCFNFEIRVNEELGITDYANKNGVLNIVYQPLRRNRTAARHWPLLVALSNKYGKTQNQILLGWIVSKGFLPLVKSSTIQHIDENLGSFDCQIESEDLERLNTFKIPMYKHPEIDWYGKGTGVLIHQLPNIFDEEYEKQKVKT